MLLAIRNYMQHHRVASTEQLSREFQIAAEALEPIMAIWINKALIRKLNQKESCGTSCRSCQPKPIVYYEWLPAEAPRGR